MKLLFDQNLSFRLVTALADLYPGSAHVRALALAEADDDLVWRHAAQHGFVIISKDADFHQRSFVFGAPPKVIWIRLGNCSTDEVERLLRARHGDVLAFEQDPLGTFLALSP